MIKVIPKTTLYKIDKHMIWGEDMGKSKRLTEILLLTAAMAASVLAAILAVGAVAWIIRNPEVTALTAFGIWVLRFGWKEALM